MKKQSISSIINTSAVFVLWIILLTACHTDKTKHLSEETITTDPEKAINVRAKSLELDTKYNLPPGDPLAHHASGFAKILCSAVFITGLDFDFAAENIGYFTAPYEHRSKFKRELDMEGKAVHVTLPNGVIRTAKYLGDLGCSCLPLGVENPYFDPPSITSNLPDASSTAWPIGDDLSESPVDSDIDLGAIREAVELAFQNPEGQTAAFVVTHKGQIVGEKYKEGIDMHTSLESWSMGKSLTATLIGRLIQQGVYTLNQPAPIPEWQVMENDGRAKIKISDILKMSSGLRFRAPLDPDFDPSIGYPDHLFVYTGTVNSFEWTAQLPQQWLPDQVGRYRNCDPVLANYLVRLGVEGKGEDYHTFPTRQLFDKIGMRNMVLETDPYGNYLLQGYEFGSARDWARLGNLYLQDGVWNGERLLPEGFVDFASTLAPGWKADDRPIYGGFFWLNGDGNFPIPKDAYFMAGAGGQFTIIIPSHDLVVVRLGHYKGSGPGGKDLNAALEKLVNAVKV